MAKVDTTTVVLKQEIALPILLALKLPRKGGVHKDSVSSPLPAPCGNRTHDSWESVASSGNSVEEIAAASQGPKWFQLYVPKDRAIARKLVERAERAGFKAIIVTVDLGERKDADRRNRFALPQNVLLKFTVNGASALPWTTRMTYSNRIDRR